MGIGKIRFFIELPIVLPIELPIELPIGPLLPIDPSQMNQAK